MRPAEKGDWSEAALRVMRERYLSPGEEPEDMLWRVACAVSGMEEDYERWAEEFYGIMVRREFLPNSPTLMNAGRGGGLQLSACYVLPIEDSIVSIYGTMANAAVVHQCLVEDTLVLTDQGLIRLKDVLRGSLIGTDGGPFRISVLHDNGEQPVFEVKTRLGFSITGTARHKLLVVGEDGLRLWKEIGDLKEGDWLVLKPGSWLGSEVALPEFVFERRPGRNETSFRAVEHRLPRRISPELAELIGFYIGDGSANSESIKISVSADSPDVVERIKSLSRRLFGKEPTTHKASGKRVIEVSISSVQIRRWFDFLGITKESSKRARVPRVILRSPEAIAAAFLRGLFTADGCVRKSGHITLVTASDELARELQVLMLAIGIPARLDSHITYFSFKDFREEGYKRCYLSVCTKAGFRAFRRKVGFSDREKQRRLSAVDDSKIFTRGEVIPNQRQRLRVWCDGLPYGAKSKGRLLRRAFFGDLISESRPRALTRQKIASIMGQVSIVPPFFEELLAEEFVFTRVTAVRYAGIRRVFDLTVPKKHAYLANGFITHNSGGGTGFAFSRLRQRGAPVKTAGGVASGPVTFLRAYDGATEAIKQGGRRRGANMAILACHHPDILEFIDCKLGGGIRNFNISVAITDGFMTALAEDRAYDLCEPHTGRVVGQLKAREVFDRIVQAAWRTGDPGLFFITRCNASRANPVPTLETIEATNPCGEQPLGPNDVCNLGSINLAAFAVDPNNTVLGGPIMLDWNALQRTVQLAVRFLDDVIDVNPYPLPAIAETARANRRVGLGVMGWADLLTKVRVSYDSERALDLAEEVMGFIQREAVWESERLSEARGPFPRWKDSIYGDGGFKPRRNATVTTIAPTGTISIIAGCSSGIEPLFALAYQHRVRRDDGERVLPFFNAELERAGTAEGWWTGGLKLLVATSGRLERLGGEYAASRDPIPSWVYNVFKTAHEIAPEWHVRHQAAFQRHVDNGVSKTVNLPSSATPEDVAKAYLLAWETGCLGITVFRDGCKGEQVLNVGVIEGKMVGQGGAGEGTAPKKKPRPAVVHGATHRVETPLGTAYVTVNVNGGGEPMEVFANVGKAGTDTFAVSEAIGRLASYVLRLPSPVPARERVREIADQLGGIGGSRQLGLGKERVRSLPDAIAKVLAEYASGSLEAAAPAKPTLAAGMLCPECGEGALAHEEGCLKCYGCGFSEC